MMASKHRPEPGHGLEFVGLAHPERHRRDALGRCPLFQWSAGIAYEGQFIAARLEERRFLQHANLQATKAH
ncbi:MAG TPA: hypothetical protein VFG71_06940 [Nitrospiraceae bacterium]|nr:hypothetical protein [Nitrospiraceae bacterium]